MPKGLLKIHGEKKKIWNFLTTFSGYKELWYKLKAQVKQIKTQPWPFKNCLLLPEISSFIHRDDFWSIVKLVAYARQPLKMGRFSMVLLVFLGRLKVRRKSSMQYWLVGLKNARVYTFALLRVVYQALKWPRAASERALEQTIPSANVTSLQSAQLFLQLSINS